MKAVLFSLLLISNILYANRIDSLKTDNDVLEFLKSANADFRSEKFNKIEVRSTETIRHDLNCGGIADQWQVKNWEKADFNNDGLTDLFVLLYWYDYGVYVILDNGDGSFKLETLSNNIFEKCELAKPIKINDQQLLLFYEKKQIPGRTAKDNKIKNQFDTLIYKSGGFVELNRQPSKYNIDSVEFHTSACYGSCPIFSIATDKNGNAVYNAGIYNPRQGKFFGTIKKKDVDDILGLINYLSISKLDNDYQVSWTDDQTCWVRIRFSDGSIKEIRDYGLRGTFGLRLLYNFFFDLRKNQDWK